MAYKMYELLSNSNNHGGNRNTANVDYIVIHYTANDGDSAWANANYFHNNNIGASAHYFVDDDSVYNSVPENYEAWHCGGNTYYHSNCRNYNSIGIELCDTNANGAYYPTHATINNALELTKSLMKKFNIPKSNVIRHYDVTHKLCPGYWCGTVEKNNLWKSEFWNKLSDNSNTSDNTPSPAPSPSNKQSKPDVTYMVRTGGRWLPAVQNLEDYAGICGQAITDVAIKVSNGSVKYRVHIKGGKWLPYVTGCNTNDHNNGYAGNGQVIDAVEIYYSTPNDLAKSNGYYKAKYRVSPVGENYYDWQHDNETNNNQDGYAGCFGRAIDRLQIVLK